MNLTKLIIISLILQFTGQTEKATAKNIDLHYTLSLNDPGTHRIHINLRCSGLSGPVLDFKMPAWMPGYYQLLDYAKNIGNFHAKDDNGHELGWSKTDTNTWRVAHPAGSKVTISYDVTATKAFVAQPWLDSTHAYITPAGVFMYIDGYLKQEITLEVRPFSGWNTVATGLEAIKAKPYTYQAPDFDILYDCPILAGNLEKLPAFTVNNKPHYFIGYHLGEFDKQQFTGDLKKIVEQGVAVIGDIPYDNYTFLAIGAGPGGIEHLNSSTIGFSGSSMKDRQSRQRMLCFIAHEYFHHYNVKRIRPIALGPFDYQRENRTDQLWVSEGLTVYYEYMLVARAGLMTGEELLHHFSSDIASYEKEPGHFYQSLAQASENTWSDGPFGGKKDSSISYYQKGPAVGLLLDLAIRHHTGNKRSLDDVMRTLYKTYYQQKKRGFTGDEFRKTCETITGTTLTEIFDYIYTTKEPDYAKYLSYGGLGIDNSFRIYPLPTTDSLQATIQTSYLTVPSTPQPQ
jgi:predicted metalloprotease with PDZ domain